MIIFLIYVKRIVCREDKVIQEKLIVNYKKWVFYAPVNLMGRVFKGLSKNNGFLWWGFLSRLIYCVTIRFESVVVVHQYRDNYAEIP